MILQGIKSVFILDILKLGNTINIFEEIWLIRPNYWPNRAKFFKCEIEDN